MTFRVQRSTAGRGVVLMLSGDIATDCASELHALVEAEGDQPLVLDLREVAVVDRAGVLLLGHSESCGATLTNCPSYVREWIERERDAADEQRKPHMRRDLTTSAKRR